MLATKWVPRQRARVVRATPLHHHDDTASARKVFEARHEVSTPHPTQRPRRGSWFVCGTLLPQSYVKGGMKEGQISKENGRKEGKGGTWVERMNRRGKKSPPNRSRIFGSPPRCRGLCGLEPISWRQRASCGLELLPYFTFLVVTFMWPIDDSESNRSGCFVENSPSLQIKYWCLFRKPPRAIQFFTHCVIVAHSRLLTFSSLCWYC
jgi:hypothetical protein